MTGSGQRNYLPCSSILNSLLKEKHALTRVHGHKREESPLEASAKYCTAKTIDPQGEGD